MTTTLLASFPSPPQGVWYVGPVAIRAYAICIIIGIIIAIVWGDRRWVARGGEKGTVFDIAIWAVPFGLIGGRLYHVLTDWSTYFGADATAQPIDALKIWDGGLGIWGAVALGALGAWIGCRVRGIPLPAFGDAIAPGILLAQGIGRIGNYFNEELYGRPTSMPWGLEITERVRDGHIDMLDGVSNGNVIAVVQPTFLYELIWNLLVVLALVWIDRKFVIGHGRLFALYVAGYCFGRFWIELLRDDHATHVLGVRINSITSAVVFVLAIAYFMWARRGRDNPHDLLSRAAREEIAADSAGRGDAGADPAAGEDGSDCGGSSGAGGSGGGRLETLQGSTEEADTHGGAQ
ncbi:prolipoprotein diacylglyceryl transferase [Tomitella cavernea]|uniref:Phosphatidylglycerol--prolipoprotein diacylglyceryl transferase n=1 Tax=Tomitella cavernea TaxID=1387982 RepID=A0ABP9CUX9_9ACTN|nr:prolipoprotein diacylglyceryl transferase [Tomitella cavernea]